MRVLAEKEIQLNVFPEYDFILFAAEARVVSEFPGFFFLLFCFLMYYVLLPLRKQAMYSLLYFSTRRRAIVIFDGFTLLKYHYVVLRRGVRNYDDS